MAESIGKGELVSGGDATGRLRRADTVAQVFGLLKEERLEEVVALCESASAAVIAPILPKVAGVVCESGGSTSHLAIVARELGVTCLMGADLPQASPDADLEGSTVRIDSDGSVERLEEA